MGMNIAEKILAGAAGVPSVVPGEIAIVAVGTSVLTDMNFFPASWREILKVADPAKVVIVLDHFIPRERPAKVPPRTRRRGTSPSASTSPASMMSAAIRASAMSSSPTRPMRCRARC